MICFFSCSRLKSFFDVNKSVYVEQGLSQDFIFISYFEAQNNPRTLARPGYAGLWQVLPITKDCFWGNFENKVIKNQFSDMMRHHIRNQSLVSSNLIPHNLSYCNFLNICRRKKIQKPTERSFCQFFNAIFIGFNRWLVIFCGWKYR